MPSSPAFVLYLISDERLERFIGVVDDVLGEVPAGTIGVQLRAKGLDGRPLLAAADRLREVTARRGALLLVNDRVDVAMACGADGVHLPIAGLSPAVARRLHPRLLIGASTHSPEEARRAVEQGADLLTAGPVWPTPSKRGMGDPIGPDGLARIVAATACPTYALGAVDEHNASMCRATGARLACIRAVVDAADPPAAAARLVTLAVG